MKAAICFEPGKPLEIRDVTIDKPGPREVLIRTAATGVCRSDLHFVDGSYPAPLPFIPGHEAAGHCRGGGRWRDHSEARRCGSHVPQRLLRALRILRHRAHGAVHRAGYQARAAPAPAAQHGRRTGQPAAQPVGLCRTDAGARTCLRRDRPRHAARSRLRNRLRGDDRRGRRVQRSGRDAGRDGSRLSAAAASASRQ
jgi:hypothetical protein